MTRILPALMLVSCSTSMLIDVPTTPLACGDEVCDADEDCRLCATDCGACPASCGDGTCDMDEDCTICAADCGACPASCGDGTCDIDEDCTTCAADCGACPGCTLTADHTVTSGWANVTLSEPAYDEVTLEVAAKPGGTTMDALFGVSTGAASDHSDLPVAVRFSPDGIIDARDGSSYAADNHTPYLAGAWYDLTVRIRVQEGTYDVMVGRCDGVKTAVITGAAFRSDAPGSQAPSNLAIWSSGDAALEVTAVTWTPGACTAMTCTDLGAECGDLDDGCGGTVTCGTCSSGVCDGGSCCVPLTCAATDCGVLDDGCGGTIDCGACPTSSCSCDAIDTATPIDPGDRDFGRIVASYPDGGLVVLPDGEYTISDRTVPERSAPLILVAQNRGQVKVVRVVDQVGETDQYFENLNQTVFVGIRFENVSVRMSGGHDVVFWYTHHTYPIEAHPDPTMKYCGLGRGPNGVQLDSMEDVFFFGVDVVDIGNDGFKLAGADNIQIVGTFTSELSHGGLQTRPSTTCNNSGLYYHVDGLQIYPGGVNDLLIQNSYFGKTLMLQVDTNGTSCRNLRIIDTWLHREDTSSYCTTINTRVKDTAQPGATMDITIQGSASYCSDNDTNAHIWTKGTVAGALTINDDPISDADYHHGDAGYIDIHHGPAPTPVTPVEAWRTDNPYPTWPCVLEDRGLATGPCQ